MAGEHRSHRDESQPSTPHDHPETVLPATGVAQEHRVTESPDPAAWLRPAAARSRCTRRASGPSRGISPAHSTRNFSARGFRSRSRNGDGSMALNSWRNSVTRTSMTRDPVAITSPAHGVGVNGSLAGGTTWVHNSPEGPAGTRSGRRRPCKPSDLLGSVSPLRERTSESRRPALGRSRSRSVGPALPLGPARDCDGARRQNSCGDDRVSTDGGRGRLCEAEGGRIARRAVLVPT